MRLPPSTTSTGHHFGYRGNPATIPFLLFVLSSDQWKMRVLEFFFQKFVDCEGNSLTRCYSHYSWCNSLVKSMEAFLSIHGNNISRCSCRLATTIKREGRFNLSRTTMGRAQQRISIHPCNQKKQTVHMMNRSTNLNISPAMVFILPKAVSPGIAGFFWSLVLIVSIGAFESGPIAPEISPMSVVWYEGNGALAYSGWYFCSICLNSVYAVKFTAWLVPGAH